jgi:hypothetical protein
VRTVASWCILSFAKPCDRVSWRLYNVFVLRSSNDLSPQRWGMGLCALNIILSVGLAWWQCGL